MFVWALLLERAAVSLLKSSFGLLLTQASSRVSLSLTFLIHEVGTMEDHRVALPGSAQAACQSPGTGELPLAPFQPEFNPEQIPCYFDLLSLRETAFQAVVLCSPPLAAIT